MKDGWCRQYFDALCNPFHGWMKKASYDQRLCAHVGSLNDTHDAPTVAYCSYVNNEPEEMKPGAVAMGDAKRIVRIQQQLKNKGIEQLSAVESDFSIFGRVPDQA